VRDGLPVLSDEEWSWPTRVLFPNVVSSVIEQRGCTKLTHDGVYSLPRHRSEGVGIKHTKAQKIRKDAEKNTPELTNGGKLQSKNQLNVTMPPSFHRLVG